MGNYDPNVLPFENLQSQARNSIPGYNGGQHYASYRAKQNRYAKEAALSKSRPRQNFIASILSYAKYDKAYTELITKYINKFFECIDRSWMAYEVNFVQKGLSIEMQLSMKPLSYFDKETIAIFEELLDGTPMLDLMKTSRYSIDISTSGFGREYIGEICKVLFERSTFIPTFHTVSVPGLFVNGVIPMKWKDILTLKTDTINLDGELEDMFNTHPTAIYAYVTELRELINNAEKSEFAPNPEVYYNIGYKTGIGPVLIRDKVHSPTKNKPNKAAKKTAETP